MNAYLLRHAIANIWCNPGQDRQFVYRLARLSPRAGVTTSFRLHYTRLPLPTEHTYHVYQLGRVVPRNLALPRRERRWVSLTELATDHQLHTELYVVNGIQFPRFESYVWLTPGQNLVVAVRINDRIHDLTDSDLYIRFYANAFFDSDRSEGERFIETRGLRVTDNQSLLKFQREIKDWMEGREGYPQYFVNGRLTHRIAPTTAGEGDVVEFLWDNSIKAVKDYPIADLRDFHSDLDTEKKFLLHYRDGGDRIEFYDDLDVYLIKPGDNDRFRGVTYHRNEGHWLRQLTHKDYSVPVERLRSFVATHTEDPRHEDDPDTWRSDAWETINDLTLRVYFRHSGYDRPLVPEAHRIQALYYLDDEDVVNAMVGDHATLDLWQAAELEKSPYVAFMGARPSFVYPLTYNDPSTDSEAKRDAQELVGDVYGYHAAASILADTPSEVFTDSGRTYAELAYSHQRNSTVFEYDENGVLLEWHPHVAGQWYRVHHPDCTRVEAIAGYGNSRSGYRLGTDNVEIPQGHNWRVYVCEVWDGEPTGEWEDITDSDNRRDYGFFDYNSDPHRWVWEVDADDVLGAVLVDDGFLCYDTTVTTADGHLRFSVTGKDTPVGPDGETPDETNPLYIPPGQLDVFLNGRALAETLDFTVQWPEVVIHNLEYLADSDDQDITVRGISFCDSNFERLATTEVGFVEHGVLSRNERFNLHSHKVYRVVINGHYHSVEDLVFDEERRASVIETERNGAPYFIQTPPVVFRDVYPKDQEAREKDDEREARISDYLTEYLPPIEPENPDFIETRYHLISVFANKLLHDLREDLFYPEGIEGHYSERDVREWCEDYRWLLDYDLCNTDYDQERVKIYPHWFGEPVALNLYKYRLYYRALQTFLRHPPDLSAFVTIA